MTGLSLPGLIGAVVGTVVAAINYYVIIGLLEKNAHEQVQTLGAQARDSYERKMALVRRGILTVDLIVFAGVGYWLGKSFFE